MADLGHGVANPILVLESLDFPLDEGTEMLACHLGWSWCPRIGYVLELQWGFLDVAFDGIGSPAANELDCL